MSDKDDEEFQELLRRLDELTRRLDNATSVNGVHYKTNDLVALENQRLTVNSSIDIALDRREAIVLGILARFALETSHQGGPQFLPKNQLADLIEQEYGHQWHYPMPQDIDRAVSRLRTKLRNVDISPNLIETARRVGLRISTRPDNIQVLKLPPT